MRFGELAAWARDTHDVGRQSLAVAASRVFDFEPVGHGFHREYDGRHRRMVAMWARLRDTAGEANGTSPATKRQRADAVRLAGMYGSGWVVLTNGGVEWVTHPLAHIDRYIVDGFVALPISE